MIFLYGTVCENISSVDGPNTSDIGLIPIVDSNRGCVCVLGVMVLVLLVMVVQYYIVQSIDGVGDRMMVQC